MRSFIQTSILVLMAVPACRSAETPDCYTEEVEAHVIEQFRFHGPLSKDREYFGFIYRYEGRIESATVRGTRCLPEQTYCEVKTARAAAKIPAGARVLGEWHTHPRKFVADMLSPTDVRGANDNSHIPCYRAFYSTSRGQIFTWDAHATAVMAAMASIVLLGNYRQPATSPSVELRDQNPNVIAGR